MAITTYSELQAAISDWMDRTDISGSAADFISLAEARLNRILGTVESTATLATVTSSNLISISSLSMVRPVSLFVTDVEEAPIMQRGNGTFTILDESGFPQSWGIEGTNIVLDRPADQAYSARFVYQGRLALSNSVTTNSLLQDHPDVYLAASIVWGAAYTKDLPAGAVWRGLLTEFEAEVKSNNAQRKRSVLMSDPALCHTADTTWRLGSGT